MPTMGAFHPHRLLCGGKGELLERRLRADLFGVVLKEWKCVAQGTLLDILLQPMEKESGKE